MLILAIRRGVLVASPHGTGTRTEEDSTRDHTPGFECRCSKNSDVDAAQIHTCCCWCVPTAVALMNAHYRCWMLVRAHRSRRRHLKAGVGSRSRWGASASHTHLVVWFMRVCRFGLGFGWGAPKTHRYLHHAG